LTHLRKLIHLSALLVPILTQLTSKSIVLAALCLVLLAYVTEEVLRLRGRSLPVLTAFTLRMSEPGEGAHFIIRPVYLAIGVILALILFPTRIAYASIVIVAVGDPIAAYAGRRFGHRHIRPKKTLEGSLSGFIASFLLASLITYPLAAFLGAAGAMLLELLDIPDDNLTMPIGAGALMMLAALFAR